MVLHSIGAFMRCDQGDVPVDHHTRRITCRLWVSHKPAFGHAGYEVTDSVDDLMAGHYHMKTVDKYYHEWGIGTTPAGESNVRLLARPQRALPMSTGPTAIFWMRSIACLRIRRPRDLIMAQYGPEAPASFGASMPSEEVEGFRAATPSLSDMVKMMEQQPEIK